MNLHRLFAQEARLVVERGQDPDKGLEVLRSIIPEYVALSTAERASVDDAYRRAARALLR